MKSLIDILSSHSTVIPNKEAFTFLVDGEDLTDVITFSELDKRARSNAMHLSELDPEMGKVLLLFPPGIDYIVSFLSCIYAGFIPIPAYPPKNNKHLERLSNIIKDSGAKYIFSDSINLSRIRQIQDKHQTLPEDVNYLDSSNFLADLSSNWARPEVNENETLFLQYTSGSTGSPKGVIVTHKNLIHNEKIITDSFEHDKNTVVVGWLPLYHDMGLIGNVLQPLFLGVPCVLMSPFHFIQKPIRWLKAISKYGGTSSGSPSFGYKFCIDKIPENQLDGIDLSTWSLAYNGSEPVQQEVIENFIKKFSNYGFDSKAFYPCYGLAEATLMVTGGTKNEKCRVICVDEETLKKNEIRIVDSSVTNNKFLVSSGRTWHNQQILIVDKDNETLLKELEVGEIWVSGDSIARGYWKNEELTKHTFEGKVDGDEKKYLKTGDLGFLYEGELYVTGRVKDLIIIRGLNFYPQDIEDEINTAHPSFIDNGTIVFSSDSINDQIIVFQEINHNYPNLDSQGVFSAIVSCVTREFGLKVADIVLVHKMSIPKTSSGKKQRIRCSKMYYENQFNNLYQLKNKELELQKN